MMTEEEKKAHNKARYQRLKEEGICVTCAKQKAQEGKVNCFQCALKSARYQNCVKKKYYRMGVCQQCMKRPARPNRVECEECAERRHIRYMEMKERNKYDETEADRRQIEESLNRD